VNQGTSLESQPGEEVDPAGSVRLEAVHLDGVSYPCTPIVLEKGSEITKPFVLLQVNAPLNIDTTKELPMTLRFGGIEYSRYCGFYYLPTHKSEAEFAVFWDFLGERFDLMIDSHLNERIYAIFAKNIEEIPSSTLRILDYGVGTGTYTLKLPHYLKRSDVDLFGVDISGEMVKIARRKGILAEKISNNIIPAPDCYFHAIVSCFVIHLFEGDFTPYEEWFRVIRRSGKIVFNHRYPERTAKRLFPGCRFRDVYKSHLNDIGFVNIQTKNYHISTPNKEWDIWITCATKP
jgi:SAM-dependent methyltransferase